MQGTGTAMGIVISTNGGSSWTPVKICSQDGSQSNVAAVAPSNANILYVGGQTASYTGLVYKSTNGGIDWTAITNGIQYVPQSIAVDPQDPNIVYVGTTYEVWRSSNGGTSWTKCTFPTSAYNFGTVVVNPEDPNQVFVGCGQGVFYSQNRGLTWTDLTPGLIVPFVSQLYFNPTTGTLYAGTEGGGLYKRKF